MPARGRFAVSQAMQHRDCILAAPGSLSGRPTVGDLMSLCEENFRLFSRLAPQIREQHGTAVSRRKGRVDLHLIVDEQSRYTTLVRLTHYFPSPGTGPERPDPDLCLRIYHDASQIEVLSLRQTVLPLCSHYQRPALDAKWRVNLFLSKWLRY
jgi:uncharacterized protein